MITFRRILSPSAIMKASGAFFLLFSLAPSSILVVAFFPALRNVPKFTKNVPTKAFLAKGGSFAWRSITNNADVSSEIGNNYENKNENKAVRASNTQLSAGTRTDLEIEYATISPKDIPKIAKMIRYLGVPDLNHDGPYSNPFPSANPNLILNPPYYPLTEPIFNSIFQCEF